MLQKCKKCGKTKNLCEENFRISKNSFRLTCRVCERKLALQYRNKNIEKAKGNGKKWRKNNPNYKKEYNRKNIDKIREYRREYESRIDVRLKKNISRAINAGLKRNASSKMGDSILKHLSYSVLELKQHIESLFEDWMNWDNWGSYNPDKWEDGDPNTWTWQIDHIIPHSDFYYKSMGEEEFRKCWSLDNLRPYSAKQNCMDGSSGVRHKRKQGLKIYE